MLILVIMMMLLTKMINHFNKNLAKYINGRLVGQIASFPQASKDKVLLSTAAVHSSTVSAMLS